MRRPRAPFLASIRWRLTVWVAAVMVLSAAAVFIVVYQNTGSQLRDQIDRDITGDANQLAQSLAQTRPGTPSRIVHAATSYMRQQPYKSTSTLQFVLVPGAATVSNHPEVFGGLVPDPGESPGEQAHENRVGAKLAVPRLGYSTQSVPDVGNVLIFERMVDVPREAVVAAAGEPLVTVERAQHGVARTFVLAGLAVLVLAALGSYLAGARVSAPLRRMATTATRVDAGDLHPPMEVSSRSDDEVKVLAESFNHMLDRLAEAFASQREFIADASHELRTPLTVIRGQLEVLAAERDPSEAEVRRVERLVRAEITRVSRLVDDMLVLAQAEQHDFLRPELIDVHSFVDDLWDGVSLTAARRFELGAVPEGRLRADPDRLAQALRNLARNAIEHTAEPDGLVRLELEELAGGRLSFAVLDDGNGIPVAERERVFQRFHRTDPGRTRSAGGAGLGLAIVRAIIEAHGGQVRASDSPAGKGALVEIVLPGFSRS